MADDHDFYSTQLRAVMADLERCLHLYETDDWMPDEAARDEAKQGLRELFDRVIGAARGGGDRRRRARIETMQVLDRAVRFHNWAGPQMEGATHLPPQPPLEATFRADLVRQEVAVDVTSISDADARMAIEAWQQRGRPRKGEVRPDKWMTIADLMQRWGLGAVAPDSLKQDWQGSGKE